ncbi:MAG: VWA domain-containing protein [Deltaproteobacteria bacterium]|nr:VWA domain-containing protein [Deltaproteobacteria bacterium]
MKITTRNGCDFRSVSGDFSTTTLVELTPDSRLARIPSNVVFLVDASSSMGGNKWSMVKQAIGEIVDSLKDDDRVSLVLFHSSASEVFPLASLAQNREAMKEKIKNLNAPSGVTNLEQGLKVAYATFDARANVDKVKRVNHVILLTDGFPTDDQGYRVEQTAKYESIVQKQEHITLTGVGIGSADDYDSNFINKLSELGRGSYYHANDIARFREGLQAEIQKLESSVVGDLTLHFTNVNSRVMRIAKVAPEIVIYDLPGNSRSFEIKAGSLTKDLSAFLVQVNSSATGATGEELTLFTVHANYDGKESDRVEVKIKPSDRDTDLNTFDPEVMRASQVLQVHLNGEQIHLSLSSGDKAKATRLIENTTKIASNLGQDKVTRALTRLADDVRKGKSVTDDLATIKDESKKTKLLIK